MNWYGVIGRSLLGELKASRSGVNRKPTIQADVVPDCSRVRQECGGERCPHSGECGYVVRLPSTSFDRPEVRRHEKKESGVKLFNLKCGDVTTLYFVRRLRQKGNHESTKVRNAEKDISKLPYFVLSYFRALVILLFVALDLVDCSSGFPLHSRNY